jgi:hypothetical protein
VGILRRKLHFFSFMRIWSIAFTAYPLCMKKWNSCVWCRRKMHFLRDSGLADIVQAWKTPAVWTLSFTTSWNGDLRKIPYELSIDYQPFPVSMSRF